MSLLNNFSSLLKFSFQDLDNLFKIAWIFFFSMRIAEVVWQIDSSTHSYLGSNHFQLELITSSVNEEKKTRNGFDSGGFERNGCQSCLFIYFLLVLLAVANFDPDTFSVMHCEFCSAGFDTRAGLSSHARAHLRDFGITNWDVTISPIHILRELFSSRPDLVIPTAPPRSPGSSLEEEEEEEEGKESKLEKKVEEIIQVKLEGEMSQDAPPYAQLSPSDEHFSEDCVKKCEGMFTSLIDSYEKLCKNNVHGPFLLVSGINPVNLSIFILGIVYTLQTSGMGLERI